MYLIVLPLLKKQSRSAVAKTYVVHLAKETRYLLAGNSLEKQLAEELFVRDTDGSYWLALYQRCVHLGTTVAFRDDCKSFKCPSHGAHYHCDGEYLVQSHQRW
jgi:cytochrome b6-f complex iron-sulfur subunit